MRKFNFKTIQPKVVGSALGAGVVVLSDKFLASLDGKIKNGGLIVLGILGPQLLKARPNSAMDKAGEAIAAIGMYNLAKTIPALSGFDEYMEDGIGAYDLDDEYIDDDEITGLDDADDGIGEMDDFAEMDDDLL